jgi:rhomboid protease GluP
MALHNRGYSRGYPRVADEDLPGRPGTPPQQGPSPIPWVSYGIIGLSAFMFLVVDHYRVTTISIPGHRSQFVDLPFGSLYGPLVRAGEWWRVLAYAVEHANWLHIAMNMSVVWTLGIALERMIGSGRFLVVSLITCLGSAAMALVFSFNQPMVGASGMILGWAGVMFPIVTRQGRRGLGVWLVQVALISLLPNVSWQGHLGGFLAGLPCGLALRHGPAVFRRSAPFLILAAAAATYFAAHPEHLFGH